MVRPHQAHAKSNGSSVGTKKALMLYIQARETERAPQLLATPLRFLPAVSNSFALLSYFSVSCFLTINLFSASSLSSPLPRISSHPHLPSLPLPSLSLVLLVLLCSFSIAPSPFSLSPCILFFLALVLFIYLCSRSLRKACSRAAGACP